MSTPIGELREQLKQIRSNNRSLAAILTTGAIDEIMALIRKDREAACT